MGSGAKPVGRMGARKRLRFSGCLKTLRVSSGLLQIQECIEGYGRVREGRLIGCSIIPKKRGLTDIGARVVTMIQDQNGGIWIGTPLGVNRFDGTVWHAVDGAEIGQLNQGVQTIYEDRTGVLWFGLSRNNRRQSGNLISRFDGVDWEIFSVNDGLPNSDVQTILEDNLGNLWVGTTSRRGNLRRFQFGML